MPQPHYPRVRINPPREVHNRDRRAAPRPRRLGGPPRAAADLRVPQRAGPRTRRWPTCAAFGRVAARPSGGVCTAVRVVKGELPRGPSEPATWPLDLRRLPLVTSRLDGASAKIRDIRAGRPGPWWGRTPDLGCYDSCRMHHRVDRCRFTSLSRKLGHRLTQVDARAPRRWD